MNTTVVEEMKMPSFNEMQLGLIAFFSICTEIARIRSNSQSTDRFVLISETLNQEFSEKLTEGEVQTAMESAIEEGSNISISVIYEEISYLCSKHKEILASAYPDLVLPEASQQYNESQADPLDSKTIKDIEIVKSSLGFVLNKLPKWVQKILDVVMEVLKLTRGGN